MENDDTEVILHDILDWLQYLIDKQFYEDQGITTA